MKYAYGFVGGVVDAAAAGTAAVISVLFCFCCSWPHQHFRYSTHARLFSGNNHVGGATIYAGGDYYFVENADGAPEVGENIKK